MVFSYNKSRHLRAAGWPWGLIKAFDNISLGAGISTSLMGFNHMFYCCKTICQIDGRYVGSDIHPCISWCLLGSLPSLGLWLALFGFKADSNSRTGRYNPPLAAHPPISYVLWLPVIHYQGQLVVCNHWTGPLD